MYVGQRAAVGHIRQFARCAKDFEAGRSTHGQLPCVRGGLNNPFVNTNSQSGGSTVPTVPGSGTAGANDPAPEEAGVIRLLLVDDHAWLRAMVAKSVGQTSDMRVVGECTDGSEVSSMALAVNPDVVLMDVSMPRVSGIQATRELRRWRPGSRVLFLTGSVTAQTVQECRSAGAVGCLPKDGNFPRLLSAIRDVAADGYAWPAIGRPVPC